MQGRGWGGWIGKPQGSHSRDHCDPNVLIEKNKTIKSIKGSTMLMNLEANGYNKSVHVHWIKGLKSPFEHSSDNLR